MFVEQVGIVSDSSRGLLFEGFVVVLVMVWFGFLVVVVLVWFGFFGGSGRGFSICRVLGGFFVWVFCVYFLGSPTNSSPFQYISR